MTTPADQLKSLKFRRSAASALRKAAGSGDAQKFRKALASQHRNARKYLEKSSICSREAILWSVDFFRTHDEDQKLTSLLSGGPQQQKEAAKRAIEAVITGSAGPLAILLAARDLVRHGRDLPPETVVRLYASLATAKVSCTSDFDASSDDVIRQLVCEGEIPWLLSLVLADLKRPARGKQAAGTLKDGLNACTDTDGFLHADWMSDAAGWLAVFARTLLWGKAFDETWMSAKTHDRLTDAARHCVTLLTPAGLVTHPPQNLRQPSAIAADVIAGTLQLANVPSSSPFLRLATSCAPSKKKKRKKGPKRASKQILTSNQSDWGEAGVLRTGLQVDADVAAVSWNQPETELFLAILGTPLLSGRWSSEVKCNGESIGPVTDWSCSCWFCDEDAAFLELEADPQPGVHLVRHVMLLLRDHAAVVCETVTSDDENAEIQLTSCTTLAADPLAVTNSITRDLTMHADCVSCRLIPAWLEDDRIQHAIGDCSKVDDQLVMTSTGTGGTAIPLVLDWHPERLAQDADWNRLTITEARSEIGPRSAAGFRVRVGNYQLLIYRSLRPGAFPRAVLGQHMSNETLYGRVRKSGNVSQLVLVDGE